MKKLPLILLCFHLVSSCQSDEVKEYEREQIITQVDTLNIEQIKIETH